MTLQDKLDEIDSMIFTYGDIDGEHHKQWLLNEIIKTIHGDKYEEWVKDYEYIDGVKEYEWDVGIAP